MRDGFSQVKVVMDDGSSRAFFGVKELARPAPGDRLPFPDSAVGRVDEEKARIALEVLGLESTPEADSASSGEYAVLFSRQEDPTDELAYFAMRFADGSITAVFYEGKVYVCNESGETVESFGSRERKR